MTTLNGRVAVRCSVMQCDAVCCRMLQYVAVCCSVLQCIAVRCSINALHEMFGANVHQGTVGESVCGCER